MNVSPCLILNQSNVEKETKYLVMVVDDIY